MAVAQRNETPGDLELVRRFVNTRDVEEGTDELDGPESLLGWFSGSGLIDDEAAADEDGGPTLGPESSGVSAALGRILAAVVRATDEGIWGRLKVCSNDACQWAFYDRSRNRSGKWCTMEVCGNRMKARTFRQRQGTGEG